MMIVLIEINKSFSWDKFQRNNPFTECCIETVANQGFREKRKLYITEGSACHKKLKKHWSKYISVKQINVVFRYKELKINWR